MNRTIDEPDGAKKRAVSEAFCDWARTGVTDRKSGEREKGVMFPYFSLSTNSNQLQDSTPVSLFLSYDLIRSYCEDAASTLSTAHNMCTPINLDTTINFNIYAHIFHFVCKPHTQTSQTCRLECSPSNVFFYIFHFMCKQPTQTSSRMSSHFRVM